MFAGSQTQLFAEYNRWMNSNVYTAAAGLSDEQRKEDRGAFFRSVHGTLDHILWGDRAWMARFKGERITLPAVGTLLYEDFDELRVARTEKDREIIEWATGVTAEWLAGPFTWMGKQSVTRPAFALVAHMFNHQTHHRGQVTTLLSQFGVDPGVTDLHRLPALNED